MKFTGFKIYLVLIISSLIAGYHCGKNTKKVDLSGIEVQCTVQRFEIDLFSINEDSDSVEYISALLQLNQKYPDFFPLFMEDILNITDDADSIENYFRVVKKFKGNKYVQGLYDTVQLIYPDVSDLQKELSDAFRHVKYYFPNKPIPQIVTFLSEFGNGVLTYDSTILGIGLDMYLGSDYRYYSEFFPDYIINRLDKKYILPDCMKVWYNLLFENEFENNRELVNKMIESGKQLYFVEHMLPEYEEHLLINYSEDQYKWCFASEYQIWQFFVDKDLLFNTNPQEANRYLGEGPATPGMPPEAPGNIGSWLGWQIVRKFMENSNGAISMEQLMNNYTSEQIFSKSKYKPKKPIL